MHTLAQQALKLTDSRARCLAKHASQMRCGSLPALSPGTASCGASLPEQGGKATPPGRLLSWVRVGGRG